MTCTMRLVSQMVEEQKALVLQKYARAWLARRRFQTMRRLVLNVQLSYRVQQLRKKIEEQVKETGEHLRTDKPFSRLFKPCVTSKAGSFTTDS